MCQAELAAKRAGPIPKPAWPIPKRAWHHPNPRLAPSQPPLGTIPTPAWHMLKLAGVGTKPRLAEIKGGCHAGPREGHLLSRGPVPGWCTGYQSAQGLKSAQRDLAMCQVLPPAHPVRSSPLGTI
ncbi:hypothetical protein PGT21_032281 [Puccinia graminis f. sp. tritici]|uniref:Uncharacterized protein n=1 Tax=Puccinia graminis f. sp. tritici TaxID=56615 RepID=A0A5B0PB25_PUCGR|nr:hypothetical protein PGT21_032281 [Puccinia graminis f. sp. tritici]